MKRQINAGRITLLVGAIAVGLALSTARLTQPAKADAEKNALTVQAEASQGSAEPGNTLPANFLVIVTDESGAPVVGLDQSNFQIINHFRLPEQTCGFSNRISSFHDVHTGAYQIQVLPRRPAACSTESPSATARREGKRRPSCRSGTELKRRSLSPPRLRRKEFPRYVGRTFATR